MKIVFFTHYFPPEVNAPANRTHEHCREWAKAGHEIHVVTGIPSHPLGRPFASYRRLWYQHESIDGIHVHRVWTYLAPNKGVVRRTLNYLSFIPTAVFRAWRLGNCDVAIGTSPQFFCAVGAWLYSRLRRVPFVFELRDLWPESISAVGAIRKNAALAVLEYLELKMYKDAAGVVCLTKAFMDNLAARGVDRPKLHFVPNGIVPAFWSAGDRAKGRARLGINDHDVVVSYVGTIGMAHGLRTTLEAAALMKETQPGVKFLIVGDGAELESLREAARSRQLTNVAFTGLLSRQLMPDVLAATDISLVTLKPSPVFKTVLPSKMFESMAASRPILLGVEGEAQQTLERAGAGLAVKPGDAAELAVGIERLVSDPKLRAQMGRAGAEFVESEFSRSTWARRYLEILVPMRKTSPTAVPVGGIEPQTLDQGARR